MDILSEREMYKFKAELDIIGINPFVFIPDLILKKIFSSAGKDKGHIPVHGKVNCKEFQQTLVKFRGDWRLYINTQILKKSPERIEECIDIEIDFDNRDRNIPIHPDLKKALDANPKAKTVFKSLSASRQKEIIRYISSLKTESSIAKNIERAIGFLGGANRFVGRKKP